MRETLWAVGVGALGTVLDSALLAAGATRYPGTDAAWPEALVPPWITALWVAFALLPRVSLRWLAGRTTLAALLGAVGGPLSYLAGERMGAVALADAPAFTVVALAVEYALLTPLLLRFAPGTRGATPR